LPRLLRRLGARSLLDAGCGDFHWMAHVELDGVEYIGVDVVPELIEENRRRHGRPGRSFIEADLISDPLPRADAILCRDTLIHLPDALLLAAVANIARSGASYLLASTFVGRGNGPDIVLGDWRPTDLQAPPFSLPEPLELVDDRRLEPPVAEDKRLGVWRLADLAV
jgi:SAM-dependent methyltransferase